jgi:hypothetical protein
MSLQRRHLALFLVIDAIAVAAMLAWFVLHRQARPRPAPPAAVVPAVADPQAAALPEAPAGMVECHGTFGGQPFWLRLSAPDPELGGNRRLQLVYTPPVQAEVEGAAIHDAPVLVLDSHLRVVKWDNRDGATGALLGEGTYTVVREIHTPGNDQTALKTRKLSCAAAWDLRLAPLLAALAWRPAGSWAVPVADLWGPRTSERMTATGHGPALDLAGLPLSVQAEGDRVGALLDARGQALVTIAAWQ